MADSKKYDGSQWEHSLRKLGTATETLTLPQIIYADGTAATIGLKGNEQHTGTPSPSNPIAVNGVGERTSNLANGFSWGYYAFANGNLNTLDKGWVHTDKIPCKASTKYTGSSDIVEGSRWIGFVFWDSNGDYISTSNQQKSQPYPTSISLTVTTPSNAAYMAMNVAGAVQERQIPLDTVTNFQVTEGETVLPYEPYGYKIPILNGGVTTNIYLGSTQTTRQIKKYEFTGQEPEWRKSNAFPGSYFIPWSVLGGATRAAVICSHASTVSQGSEYVYGTCLSDNTNFNIIIMSSTSTLTEWTQYLTDQYTNGTPVIIYYVLATAETAAVNEPLMKIGTYADTLSNATSIPTTEGANSITVDTTVQPSEFTATWTGWHDASVKEYDGSDWQ